MPKTQKGLEKANRRFAEEALELNDLSEQTSNELAEAEKALVESFK